MRKWLVIMGSMLLICGVLVSCAVEGLESDLEERIESGDTEETSGAKQIEDEEPVATEEWGNQAADGDAFGGTEEPEELPLESEQVDEQDHEGMVFVPEGQFWMGCDESNATQCYEWEKPLHQVWLPAFWVDIYEVTNAEYRECVEGGDCTMPWWEGAARLTNPEYNNHPVNGIDWYQAAAYCQFAGKRILTEAEWEKAARGTGRTNQYPWDENEISCQRANYYQGGHLAPLGYCISPPEGDTTPVGFYNGENWFTNDQGTFQTIDSPSPFGLYDVIGNAAEWVSGNIPAYPWPGVDSGGLFGSKEVARGCANSIYEHLCDVHCRGLLFEKKPDPDDENYLDDIHFFGIRCGMDSAVGAGRD